jgi:hypothetical protein
VSNKYSSDLYCLNKHDVKLYIYLAALNAVVLCSDKQISNRMKMTVMFPEMNPQMDSYRWVTLNSVLEYVFGSSCYV